ncbi:MAG: hypothetical protein WKH64_18520 [Chloroflexia bacterium]
MNGMVRLGRRMSPRAHARREDGGISLEQAARRAPEWGRLEVRHIATDGLIFPGAHLGAGSNSRTEQGGGTDN